MPVALLIEVAERFAILLGVQHVVLSSLPHVLPYYYKLGFSFIDHESNRIDVSQWVVTDESGKEQLYPDLMYLTFDATQTQ